MARYPPPRHYPEQYRPEVRKQPSERKKNATDVNKPFNLKRPRGELMDDILNCNSISEAKYLLTKIRCFRREMNQHELLFMEIQTKLQYGYFDEARAFLDEVVRTPGNKDFLYRMILYMAQEFQRIGIEGIRPFRDILMKYQFEEQRDMFYRVSRVHQDMTCQLWLCLLSLLSDALRRPLSTYEAGPLVILQHRVLEYAMDNEEECEDVRGFWNLGQSMLKTHFADMDDRKIQFAYNLFIKSCVQELICKNEHDTMENRITCTEAITQYVTRYGALLFFKRIMQKIDSVRLIPTNFETFSIAHELTPYIPNTWSPALRPYFQFFLAGARMQLPGINPNMLYFPVRKLLHVLPTRTSPKLEESFFRDAWTGLSGLWLKVAKFGEDIEEVIHFIDRKYYYFFFVVAHFYSARYQEVVKMEQFFDKKYVPYKIYRFSAELMDGKKPIQEFLLLAGMALDKKYTEYSGEFTDFFLSGPHRKCHIILPKQRLGQWLLFIAPQVLEVCGGDNESFLIAQFIISQFEFSTCGQERLTYVWEKLKTKESLKTVNLDKYLVKEPHIQRFIILGQKFETPWDPKECFNNLNRKIPEQDILLLLLQFLREDFSLVLK